MRPVSRGAIPLGPSGDPLQISDYRLARDPLIDRIGEYCSYCERRIPDGMEVEHVIPKSLVRALEHEWTNFLLSCKTCNTCKGDKPPLGKVKDFLWPDDDNTLLALAYDEIGTVAPATGLSPDLAACVMRTVDLTKLNRPLDSDNRPDKRPASRRSAWRRAEVAKATRAVDRSAPVAVLIIALALETGHFSIWMTVFHDDPEMRKRLIEAFPGTARDCFDERGAPVTRPGGAV